MYSIYAGDELLYSDVYPNKSRKVTSPTLKMAVDEAGSLGFTVSEINKCYTSLQRMRTIITVKKYDIPIWDGRIIEEYRDFNKNKKMYVEGSLAFLNDTTQPIHEYKNASLEDIVTSMLSIHNNLVDSSRQIFWGGIADSFNPEAIEYWVTAYECTLTAIQNVADYLGCHYLIQKDPYTGINQLVFFGGVIKNSNQTIMFGENLLDYTENYDLSKLATVLLPLSKTDRESSDIPRTPGIDVDLSEVQPFDDTKHYGVLMALTDHCACRKFLKEDPHVATAIPPYRNKLNLLAENIDGNMIITGPDVVAMTVDSTTWRLPDYVQIWTYKYDESLVAERNHRRDRYNEQEAIDAHIYPDPITDTDFDFSFISNDTPYVTVRYREDPYQGYMETYSTISDVPRTYRQRAKVDFMRLVDDYGIMTSTLSKYRCAIIEIDYSKIKTLYLTATHPDGFTETCRSVSVWKKSLSFDETNTFVQRSRDIKMDSTHGYLYPSGKAADTQFVNHGFYPAFGYSVGYKMDPNADPEACVFSDLVEDTVPYILNHDKYTFVKEFTDINCFERRIDLDLELDPEVDSMRVLVVLTGGIGPFSVSLISEDDEEADSTIAIGMDQNGIDLSQAHYIRYYSDVNTWREPEPGEEHDPYHYYANDIYDEDAGYGVLVPVTEGFRLQTKEELDKIAKPNLNVWNNGTFNPYNTIDEPPSGDPRGIVVANTLDTNFNCCVIVVKASYEDPDGVKYPNSIYISTKIKGKSALYAIFEFTDGNGNNGIWDVNTGEKPKNLRELKEPIEFGKYITSFTTLSAKKITMPYAKDPNRLMMVVIGSYEESPRVWLHDPKLSEKLQYLTIASVNNGDPKLRADNSNRFTSSLEYGDIDDQNGSLIDNASYDRLRTSEPITINSDGSYMFMFESTDDSVVISADIYIYGKIDGYIRHTGYKAITSQNPYIFLPYLYEGYTLNVVFRKRARDAETVEYLQMSSNDIMYPMIWREENATTMLFAQGSPMAVTDPVTENVDIVADNTDDMTITTADYYTTTEEVCDLKVTIEIDSATIPPDIVVQEDGENVTYMIKSRTISTSYWEQPPTILQDSTNTTRQIVYKSYSDPSTVYVGDSFKINSKNNTRYKFFVTCEVTYEDGNGVTQTESIPMLPEYIRTFSVVSYTDMYKEYVPPNDSFEKYGYIEKRVDFEDVDSSAELKERAIKYLAQSQFDEMTLKVKALDMTVYNPSFDNNLDVADSVRVVSSPHGLYRDFPITELSIPMDNPSGATYELGYDNRDTLSSLMQGG